MPLILSPELKCLTGLTHPAVPYVLNEEVWAGIDQERFMKLIRYHRLWPWIKTESFSFLPDVRETIDSEKKRIILRNITVLSELARLSSLLVTNPDCLVIKGLPLSVQLYGDPFQRDVRDADILVSEKDIEPSCRLLLSSGYQLAKGRQYRFPKLYHEQSFFNPQKKTTIELHWKLSHVPELLKGNNETTLLQHRISLNLSDDVQVSTLELPAHAVYLSLHGAAHSWGQLYWIRDFARVLQICSPDQREEMQDLSARIGLKDVLERGIQIAGILYPETLNSNNPRDRFSDSVIRLLESGKRVGRFSQFQQQNLLLAGKQGARFRNFLFRIRRAAVTHLTVKP